MIDRTQKMDFTRDTVDSILELSATEGIVDADEAVFLAQTILVIIIRSLCEGGAFNPTAQDCDTEKVLH